MARPFHELLAESLTRIKDVSKDGVVRSENMSRIDRERLQKSGWLIPVVSGWYLLCSPQAKDGESTAWYASYWNFISQYLKSRFNDNYCLSAESSLDLHVGSTIVPKQLIVIIKRGANQTILLPHNTSVVIYQDSKNYPVEVETKENLRVMPLALALCRSSKSFFEKYPINAEIALSLIRDPSQLNIYLLESGAATSASRLAGAYQYIGNDDFTRQILNAMQAAGYDVVISNPFISDHTGLANKGRMTSPYKARIISMWNKLRDEVIKKFPKRTVEIHDIKTVIDKINDIYVNDAYHSLSIEGYRVSKELIEKIKLGNWSPDANEEDRNNRNALAAKGYFNAFQSVKESIRKIFAGSDTTQTIKQDLTIWYQALFSPSIEAGLLERKHLAGYRNDRVYIRNSLHTPPPKEAVLDCMDAFYECLLNEKNAVVRAILGHFIFVFIHPFMDGNGRIGRFLMNVLWVTAGYPWTIVRVDSRVAYLKSLENASVENLITDFVALIAQEMDVNW